MNWTVDQTRRRTLRRTVRRKLRHMQGPVKYLLFLAAALAVFLALVSAESQPPKEVPSAQRVQIEVVPR